MCILTRIFYYFWKKNILLNTSIYKTGTEAGSEFIFKTPKLDPKTKNSLRFQVTIPLIYTCVKLQFLFFRLKT